MKIVDKTPFLSPKGEIGLLDRLKGTLQYGLNWYSELEAQKAVIARLEKHFDKQFALIRNHALGKSGITVPMILIGPPGVYVLSVTHLRGMYRAKGDTWGLMEGNRFQPARINLLTRTARLGRALQVFLQRQGYEGFGDIEPVLLAADPGMHVESVRPLVRVVMSDALERFAVSLLQARPLLRPEVVYEIAEHILNPRPPRPAPSAVEGPAQSKVAGPAPGAVERPAQSQSPERIRGAAAALPLSTVAGPVLSTVEEPQPGPLPALNPAEIAFALEDEEAQPGMGFPPAAPPSLRQPPPSPGGLGGPRLSGRQIVLLVAIGVVEVCVLIAFILLIVLNL